MVRQKNLVDQMPMGFMLPETKWIPPTELPDMRGDGEFLGIDTETKDDGLSTGRGAGWVYNAGHIVGVSMATVRRKVYIPIRHPDTDNFDIGAVTRWVTDHIQGPQHKIFHNSPYDLGWLLADLGIPPPDIVDDSMAMAFILDENRKTQGGYSLDAVCRWQGVPGKNEEGLRLAAEAYGVNPKAELWKLPARYVGEYAEDDAMACVKLAETMLPKIEANDLTNAYRLEMDIVPLCLEMRRRGVRVDVGNIEREKNNLLGRRDTALAELSDKILVGRQIDIKDVKSPQMLAKMFDSQNIPYPKTEIGNDSFKADWMDKMDHWLPKLIVQATRMHDAGEKFIGTYIQDYTHMGRLHAEIHQFNDDRGGTVTTRFSYSDPPLQQMPSRDPLIAKVIRGLFLPEQGEKWGALDYSQQEYRLMVHFASLCGMAGVDRALAMYRDDPDTDFHNMVAQLTGLPRRKAKDVNFAKAFGAGVPKFALMTGMSEDDARETMGQYDEEMPFISRLNEFCQKRADKKGYIRMLDGARGRFDRWEPRWTNWNDVKKANDRCRELGLPLPKIAPCSRDEAMARINDPDHPWTGKVRRAFTHKAMNKLIQGSAARQTKMAMRQCWREGIVPMLQMHDELDFSFAEEAPAIRAAQIMREIVTLEVPCMVDAEFGTNWGDAKHKWDDVKL